MNVVILKGKQVKRFLEFETFLFEVVWLPNLYGSKEETLAHLLVYIGGLYDFSIFLCDHLKLKTSFLYDI